jgi:hypothetical protein
VVLVHKYLKGKNAKRSRLRWPTAGGQAMAARERSRLRRAKWRKGNCNTSDKKKIWVKRLIYDFDLFSFSINAQYTLSGVNGKSFTLTPTAS